MDFKQIIDSAIDSARFKIDDCIDFEDYLEPSQSRECKIIKQKLTTKGIQSISPQHDKKLFFD